MTPSEAVQKAVENHEFRLFRHHRLQVAHPSMVSDDDVIGVVAVCWCGTETPPFLSEKSARDAHGRHQARLALMRSFGHWDV